jgi:trimeric autotransporter adhesin
MKKIFILAILAIIMLFTFCKKDNITTDDKDAGTINDIANGDTIFINYNGTSVSVEKPLSLDAVSITMSGGDVTVKSQITDKEIYYLLKGSTSDGMFKIYSDFKYNLILGGVNITNLDGPAINIQSGKKCAVILSAGSKNSLADGTSYAKSDEDQKSTFFSEGQLKFKGTGELTVKSNSAHGICSDDYIEIQEGAITVSGAAKDGIHAGEYFEMSGGIVNIKSTGDGIDSEGYILMSAGEITVETASVDVKGISCDSTMLISGGDIKLTMGGNQSKGLKSKQQMELNGGSITINTSGAVALTASGSGNDPSYCSAVKCDSTVTISGATLTIFCTGAGGKGISSDKNVNITGGTVKITTSGAGATYKNSSGATDAYSASCISTDINTCIIGGSVTLSSSGNGGKGITSDGAIIIGDVSNSPNINITTTGAKFVVSGSDYCHPKAIVSTGAISVNNGTITISSSDDAIHSEKSYIQNNGSVTVKNSYEAIESTLITINGGSMNLTASNDGFNATMGTVSGGTEQNDGSSLIINGGDIYVNCTNGDAIDGNGNIVMNGGTVIANGPLNGVEEAADFNGSFNMNGGFFIGAGSSSNMTKAMSTSSIQQNFFLSTSSSVSSSSLLHIQDASGIDILTFKPLNGAYKFLFSSSAIVSGATYSIYTGGSSTGTNNNGLYSGGVYSGGTLKKSFTASGKVVNVSF